ncbi:hypothetical protein [Staphylococcus gallinarum]|uniref:hypothetical protein n=1 Tax=Staphylococcus gallinarum TaxID=1293 RepID=UPI001E565395|nr:hypothetical protein [Staphylococcus gallinarum]MCD8826562.1 hypothetical protein [Staphylococcus gallinarum]
MKNGYINEYKTFYDEYINEVNAPQIEEKNMPMALLMKQFKDKLLSRRNRHKTLNKFK